MVYVRPTPNTDPNTDLGTVDQTLDPSMSASTIQSKIDLAGTGGTVEWAGSTHYSINTNLRFLTGQNHFTNNGRIIKCTNTANLSAFVNMRQPKGGGPAATDVTISDLEFWGHTNVPNRPPSTAPVAMVIPYTRTFLRRVKTKGAQSAGIKGQGDRLELGIVLDTIESAYNSATSATGSDGGIKMHYLGECGSPLGSTMSILCSRFHHNWLNGIWFDISSNGAQVLATEVDNQSAAGIHIETCGGPFLVRDSDVHHNGGGGSLPNAAGPDQGIRVISSDNGQLINNDVYNNGGFGIYFFEDPDPITRTSMHCPQVGNAGDGYFFADWDVLGNQLSANGNTVNSVVTSSPATIHYSTTPVVDAITQVIETDVALGPLRGIKTKIIAQVSETDSALALTRLAPPLSAVIAQVSETDIAQPVKRNPLTKIITQVTETDSALPVTTVVQAVVVGGQVVFAGGTVVLVRTFVAAHSAYDPSIDHRKHPRRHSMERRRRPR